MKTNLTFDDMKNFLSYGLDENISMDTIRLDGSGGYMEDGLWYYQVNDESKQEVRTELQNHLDIQHYTESNGSPENNKNNT